MARKRRRIVEGVLYEWEGPAAEHDFDAAILELREIPEMDVPRHEWSLWSCERRQKWLRQGLMELYEALCDIEAATDFR
ncbi:MAG TPA: hypothetical protein VHC22_01605 [Pirellulales bacterium]|nr:hypothetical protein [Pirellulales bacterium]